jgi:hypothetical protein
MGLFNRSVVRGDPLYPAYVRQEREPSSFKIMFNVGLDQLPIGWDAASEDEAITTFLEFLNDEEQVIATDPRAVPSPGWRRVNVWFNGVHKSVLFKITWVGGFTVEK